MDEKLKAQDLEVVSEICWYRFLVMGPCACWDRVLAYGHKSPTNPE
jgi:hypothetical protein